MSRALNLDATPQHVADTCAKHKAGITAIEALVSGGTRVVLKSGDDAAIIARAYRGKLIDGEVRRAPLRNVR